MAYTVAVDTQNDKLTVEPPQLHCFYTKQHTCKPCSILYKQRLNKFFCLHCNNKEQLLREIAETLLTTAHINLLYNNTLITHHKSFHLVNHWILHRFQTVNLELKDNLSIRSIENMAKLCQPYSQIHLILVPTNVKKITF